MSADMLTDREYIAEIQRDLSELRAALAIASLCIDPGAMPSPEYESLCKSALTAIDAALQPKEPTC